MEILVLFALEEEKNYFEQSLSIKTQTKNNNGVKYNYHRAFSEENGTIEFYSYVFSNKGEKAVIKELPTILTYLNPKIVFNIGIAGKIHDYNIGEVIIANSIYSISNLKINETPTESGSKLNFGQTQKNLDPTLINFFSSEVLIKNLVPIYNELLDLYMLKEERELIDIYPLPSVYINPIATIPFVLADTENKKHIATLNKEIHAVEMEAYAIQEELEKQHIPGIFIKGISDPSDKQKDSISEQQDKANRKYAIFNASLIFYHYIDKKKITDTPFSDFYHEIVCNTHLSNNFIHNCLKSSHNENDFKKYFTFINHFINPPHSERRNKSVTNISKIIDLLVANESNTLKILGLAGTGKTSLLVILYEYLLNKYSPEYIPIYIDINRYYTQDNKYNLALNNFLIDIYNITKSPVFKDNTFSKIILIIDNIDYYRGNTTFLKVLNNINKKIHYHSIIYGIKSLPKTSILNYPKNIANIETKYEIILRTINYNSISKDIIKKFLEINYIDSPEIPNWTNDIYAKLKEEKILSIDILILSEFCYSVIKGLSYSFKDIIKKYIEKNDSSSNLEKISRDAFLYHIKREEEISSQNYEITRLINVNPNISYYLIAHYIIHTIVLAEEKLKKENLSFVYPYSINQFCKSIMNEDDNSQYEIFDKLKKIITHDENDRNWHLKAVACYLLGRFDNLSLKEEARSFLQKFLETCTNIQVDSNEKDKYLFTLRTIYISLSYLGDEKKANEYIDKLLENKEWDDINRGFHLVYYGDQPYIPRRGLSQKDNFGPFTNTFHQLHHRLSNIPINKNIDIEIFTLVSLCIKRLEKGNTYIQDKYLIKISALLNNKKILGLIKNPKVLDFCKCSLKYFEKKKFSILVPITEMYKIKLIPRTGWIKRNIKNKETIASHILFSYYLALFLLPDESPDKEYNKKTILNMLLIHDLGECRYGDIIAKEKTEEDKKKEELYFKEFSFMSYMLPYKNSIYQLSELRDNFENKKTLNGKIAKEIDELEAVNQFLAYKFDHEEEKNNQQLNIEEWVERFRNENPNMHEYVKNIFNIILTKYNLNK